MKSVKVEDAVGMVLAHDLTKIVPGVFKGAAFKKGHIIRQEDLEELKNAGKYNVFVVSLEDDQVHENEAAFRVAIAAAGGQVVSEPLEGKANIKAAVHGLLKVDTQALLEVNRLGEIALVSLHDNTVVEKGRSIAAAKIIPLTIKAESIEKAESICRQKSPVIDVKPFFPLKTGIIITGSEVYHGRIIDKFGDILKDKVSFYGGEPMELMYAPDDADFIGSLIMKAVEQGADIVLVSGGMAVDADDVTPEAIKNMASEVVAYGMPLLPGSMCMIAYRGRVPVVGIPACAMYHKTTVLDIIYPRLLTKEQVTKDDVIKLAHGGLCLNCEVCRYPVCPLGK